MSFSAVNHSFLVEGTLYNLENNESIDLTESIIDIMVRKRFLEESFPLFVIDLKTTETVRDIIRDNNCSINIRVSYYDTDAGSSEDSDDVEVAPEGIVLDTNIRIYEKPFVTTTASKDVDNEDDSNSQSEAAPFIYYRVHGIPEDLISKNEGNVNNIFKNAETIDALIYILSSIGANNPKLQESDNKEKYKNIIIPPLSAVPAIKLLQNYYTIYNDGMSLFFDTDGTYCYSPFSKNKPEENIFEIEVVSKNATGDLKTVQKPTVDRENNNIRVTLTSLPAFTGPSKVTQHVIGSETVYYTYDESFNLSQRTSTDDGSFRKIRYLWNDMVDKRFEDDFENVFKRSGTMTVGIGNLNPSLLTPYTTVNVIASDYPDAEGQYSISDMSFMFETTDLKHYRGACSLLLLKK